MAEDEYEMLQHNWVQWKRWCKVKQCIAENLEHTVIVLL